MATFARGLLKFVAGYFVARGWLGPEAAGSWLEWSLTVVAPVLAFGAGQVWSHWEQRRTARLLAEVESRLRVIGRERT